MGGLQAEAGTHPDHFVLQLWWDPRLAGPTFADHGQRVPIREEGAFRPHGSACQREVPVEEAIEHTRSVFPQRVDWVLAGHFTVTGDPRSAAIDVGARFLELTHPRNALSYS